jgi:purine-binding chemotaxis protein CheW
MPNFIEGLINLRGDLIGVLDVRKRFSKPSKEHDEETCIIVLNYNDFTLGMIVDAVQETAIIPEERVSAPPSAKLSYANQFIRNIGKVGEEVKLLMDVERFLAQE